MGKTSKASVADYSFHVAVTWWSERVEQQMAECVDRGVNSFKHFMAYKGALMVDDEILFKSFTRCRDLGALPMVHAENGDAVYLLQQQLLNSGITGPEGHALSRPPHVEAEAANRAIMIAQTVGVPLYVVHTSCREAHEAIARARAAGVRVYGEPLAQHLVLDESVYYSPDWELAASRVMSPPFRTKDHQKSLWDGLVAGSLQVVATDHCAFTIQQKKMGIDNFTMIPNGTGGIEERMKVVWHFGVNSGRLTPEEFVAVTSTNVRRSTTLYPQKGLIAAGSDADLVVWDPKASHTIRRRPTTRSSTSTCSRASRSPGLPRFVLSRGKVSVQEDAVKAEQGHGNFVPRVPNMPVNRALSRWKDVSAPKKVIRTGVPVSGV